MFDNKLGNNSVIEEERVETVEVTEEVEEKMETVEEMEEKGVEVEVEAVDEDKFSLAGLLGKTESGMKSDFYAFQIKELMQSVGIALPKGYLTIAEIENYYSNALKYGCKEIIATPYLVSCIKEIEEKFGSEKLSITAIIDYPCGESSFKAKILDVKESIKGGASSVIVVMAKRSISTAKLSIEKARLNKLCKVGKGKVGVAINVDLEEDDLRKIVKLVDSVKAKFVTLLAENVSVDKVKKAFELLTAKKVDKKIFVYSSVDNIKELSNLIEMKANKVYTEHLAKIGAMLEERFGIQI